ncbi:GntR family transcriptional regulator [Paracoccus sp. SCSIO 75233]|uniref:GntR family transcriptional regulator n=1 Tax=Paracoccus sp. SCSIO 75233 TaxID=3017782 RepID=UPI0022F10BAF|nr:GntR family transcriptional regulator [Paracoccus sp. SCSIO 75233]WBU52665.1 GntR family transcriptional regulator [Paracoccus sp. SCSIO 75233]
MEDVREEGQTTTEHAIERVREAILCGEIPPGARLHQVSLAERFGISRTPLRAALVALSHSGLVTYESNRGYRVRELSREQLNDAFMIRAEIEALACRLAANRITADEVHELHQLVDEGENFLESGHLPQDKQVPYQKNNSRFHTLIQDAARSPWVTEFASSLRNVMLSSDRTVLWNDFHLLKRMQDDHRRIVRLLETREAQKAENAMREHVIFAQEQMLCGFRMEQSLRTMAETDALAQMPPEQ